MIIFTIVAVVAVIELLFFWGKITTNQVAQKHLNDSLASLVPSTVPWWVNWFQKLWNAFHFPAMAVLLPVMIFFAVIGRNGQLVVPNEYFHGLNFVLLVSFFVWTYSTV